MKCSLGISNFLEEISSLSHSIVFLYFFALITGKDPFSFQSQIKAMPKNIQTTTQLHSSHTLVK